MTHSALVISGSSLSFTDPCWITSVAAYAMCCGFYFFTGVSAMMMGGRRRIVNNTTST